MPTYGNKKSNSYKELEKGMASCREIGCLHFVVNRILGWPCGVYPHAISL